jgi:hypothetical protein
MRATLLGAALLGVVAFTTTVIGQAGRGTGQPPSIGRYTILSSIRATGPGITNTPDLLVWVLDTATGAVSAYTVGATPGEPHVIVKLAPGPTLQR